MNINKIAVNVLDILNELDELSQEELLNLNSMDVKLYHSIIKFKHEISSKFVPHPDANISIIDEHDVPAIVHDALKEQYESYSFDMEYELIGNNWKSRILPKAVLIASNIDVGAIDPATMECKIVKGNLYKEYVVRLEEHGDAVVVHQVIEQLTKVPNEDQ